MNALVRASIVVVFTILFEKEAVIRYGPVGAAG
jgi:hypothetical protein